VSFKPFTDLTAKSFVVAQDNVDTDQIIPARFLTTTSRAGLGRCAFHDWRFSADGTHKADNPFPGDDMSPTPILIAGSNFGCGSSREHAPWALLDFGFRVVISSDIADIFKNNSLKNGLLAIELSEDTHKALLQQSGAELTVDLVNNQVTLPDGSTENFEVEAFARHCMLEGVDTLGYLLGQQGAITHFEENRA